MKWLSGTGRFAPIALGMTLTLFTVAAATTHPGAVDQTFGFQGKTLAFYSFMDTAAIVVQKDASILVVSSYFDNAVHGTFIGGVVRLLPNGMQDLSYDGGLGVGMVPHSSTLYSAALQPDGKLLVAGNLNDGGPSSAATVARLNADGTLDPTFGLFGEVPIHFVPHAFNSSYVVLPLPDGKIVIGGDATGGPLGGKLASVLARLDAKGKLDRTFGHGGIAVYPSFIGSIMNLGMQSDGKLIAIGQTGAENPPTPVLRIARFLQNGSVDTSSSRGTLERVGHATNLFVLPAMFRSDERAVVFQLAHDEAHGFDVFPRRVLPTGSTDPSFHGSPFDFGPNENVVRGGIDRGADLQFDPIGRIVVVGSGPMPQPGGSSIDTFGVGRLNPDGGLDSSFGRGGRVTTGISAAGDLAEAVALQPDGKIIVSGRDFNGQFLEVVRYLGGSQ